MFSVPVRGHHKPGSIYELTGCGCDQRMASGRLDFTVGFQSKPSPQFIFPPVNKISLSSNEMFSMLVKMFHRFSCFLLKVK